MKIMQQIELQMLNSMDKSKVVVVVKFGYECNCERVNWCFF